MRSLRVEIANPDVRIEKAANGLLVSCSSRVRPAAITDLSVATAWQRAVDDLDDGALIGVTMEGEALVEVRAFRAPASSYDVFFVWTESGALLLTDQFGCALAAIPRGRRELPPDSLADHLLFRT